MSDQKTVFPRDVILVADRRTVTFFRLAGLKNIYPVANAEEAIKRIHKVSKNPDCLVILVTERILNEISSEVEGITEQKYPLIIPVPDIEGRVAVKTDLLNELIKRKAGIEFKL